MGDKMKETRIEVEAKHREAVLKLIQELKEYSEGDSKENWEVQ